MTAIRKIVALGSMVWAVVLSAVALMLPPAGTIDASVLILIAQILVLVATILGFNLTNIINHDKVTSASHSSQK